MTVHGALITHLLQVLNVCTSSISQPHGIMVRASRKKQAGMPH